MSLGASGMASASIPKRVYCVHFNRSYKAAIANAAALSIVIGGEEAHSVSAGRPAVWSACGTKRKWHPVLAMSAHRCKADSPSYTRTHHAGSKLCVHYHSCAKGADNKLDCTASERRSFLKNLLRLQAQERFHSRMCPTDRPLVGCPCRLFESFRSGRRGDCAICVCRLLSC
jgi:hypothetical protein